MVAKFRTDEIRVAKAEVRTDEVERTTGLSGKKFQDSGLYKQKPRLTK